MKKKALSLVLASAMVASLVGCGSSAETETPSAAETTTTEAAATEAAESTSTEDKTITVAASATPHAEILEQAKSILAEQGWDLQVTVFDDYVQPNEVVDSGDFDANYFQHAPYMEQFNKEKGTKLVDAGDIHYEPFGIYPGTKKSLDEIGNYYELTRERVRQIKERAIRRLRGSRSVNLIPFISQ